MSIPLRSPCYAEIEIDAPPARVWAALCDLAAYPSWRCPFTERMELQRPGGAPLLAFDVVVEHVRLSPRDSSVRLTPVRVTEAAPPGDGAGARLCWDSVVGARFLLHATRTQRLVPLDGGARTLYTSEDVMTGLLRPLVLLLYGDAVRVGFEAMAAALKAHVEGAAPR
jgi:hypothetical protein